MGVIRKQGIFNMVITYLGITIGFVSLLFIQPRFLSKEELGLVRVLFSFCALAGTIYPMGTGSIILRYFPYFKDEETKDHGFFASTLIYAAIGFILCATILLLLKDVIVAQYEQIHFFSEHFYWVLAFVFLLGLISILTNYCFALFRTIFPSFLNDILLRLLYILVTLIYAFKFITLYQFVLLFIGTYALQFLILFFFILKIDRPSFKLDIDFLKKNKPAKIMQYGFVLSLTALANLGLKYLDVIILGKYVDLSLVGVYALAAFIPTVIDAPYYSLDKITSPKIAHAWAAGDTNQIKEIYFQSVKYLTIIGGLLFLGINLNIDSLYHIIPNNYSEGKIVVFIISLGTLMNVSTGVNDAIIFNSKNYIYGTYLLLLLFVSGVCTNLLLIPEYGIMGAAMATAISGVIYNTVKFIVIWYKFKLQPFNFNTLKIGLLIILTWLAFSHIPDLKNPYLSIALKSCGITIMYGMALIFLKIVPEFTEKAIVFIKRKL